MNDAETRSDTGAFGAMVSFLGGALVGTVLTLLLAPRSDGELPRRPLLHRPQCQRPGDPHRSSAPGRPASHAQPAAPTAGPTAAPTAVATRVPKLLHGSHLGIERFRESTDPSLVEGRDGPVEPLRRRGHGIKGTLGARYRPLQRCPRAAQGRRGLWQRRQGSFGDEREHNDHRPVPALRGPLRPKRGPLRTAMNVWSNHCDTPVLDDNTTDSRRHASKTPVPALLAIRGGYPIASCTS